ncbi:hypothetical protein K438DRAFT_1936564 [Mycena galopus ATCC 62051]|nr:hypothetical protein K438DRAFT_1936564 [Mycena galopus ATCC 62051]
MRTNTTPAQAGRADARGLRHPSYTYGWIVPFDQLDDAACKALGEPPHRLQGAVCKRWKNLGYADKYGRLFWGRTHTRPQLKVLYDPRTDSVLVDITNNHSKDQLALANPEFVQACRETLGPAKGLEEGPVWFRSDLTAVPEGYPYEFQGSRYTKTGSAQDLASTVDMFGPARFLFHMRTASADGILAFRRVFKPACQSSDLIVWLGLGFLPTSTSGRLAFTLKGILGKCSEARKVEFVPSASGKNVYLRPTSQTTAGS